MRALLSSLLIAGTAAVAAAQNWNSRLLPSVNGTFTPQAVNFAGRNWTLDDFSYAGYYLGAKPLGSVPCKVVNVMATGDITAALQTAIDTAGNAGGGIVRIPAGTFTMSGSVAVHYNNVSIEGAGSEQTFINVPSNYASEDSPYDSVFTFGKTLGKSNTGWIQGPLAGNVTAVVHRGDMRITVDNASKINIGDWVVVKQFFWNALVSRNSAMPDQWVANTSSEYAFTYLRQVTMKSGNQVSLDAPIPWTLDPANNPVQVRMTDGLMKENAGLKGVTIRFANNTLASTGRPHGSAVLFQGVRNGWIDDVQVFNFPRFGIYVTSSARITILDSWVQTAQDYGGSSYGYGFLVDPAQNILIKRCHGEDTRHNFITSHPQTSMVVMTQNASVNATQPDDTHFAFEQAILWDQHSQLNGDALEALNRGDQSTGAYETLASGVIWNFYGDGAVGRLTYGGALFLKPSPDGDLIVAGVNGAHTVYDNSQGNVSPFVKGQRMPPSPGLQVGSGGGTLQNVLYEGLYQPGLQPASLYQAQLARRIGTLPADWLDVCASAPVVNPGGVVNAASFAPGPVSPGEIVTLFGSGMGPPSLATAALDNSGRVANSLAGTRILFDDVAAPLVYTSASQAAAVVPYAAAGKTVANVQVEYNGQRSSPVSLSIAATTPGIFELNASGGVAEWVLNQDGTLNSPSNPAPVGSIVVLYATGGGQTNPAGVDGSLAAEPYPAPAAPVSVTIGGAKADVLYAGAAPGFVAGLLQVNVRVPDGVLSPASPLLLTIGTRSSQADCTVAVR